jgi:hypothetical protein
VLIEGLKPLASNDEVCYTDPDATQWFERTAYRKIAHSSCEGGPRPDRGTAHACPGLTGHSSFFWLFMTLIPIGFAVVVGNWWYRKHGPGAGAIRLPGAETGPSSSRPHYYGGSSGGALETLASVPWFILGVTAVAVEWVADKVRNAGASVRGQRGYRNIPVDEDARVLRFEDED